jgi:endonuclease/exonuclease/phosphatase family metal-dependent hydrolase
MLQHTPRFSIMTYNIRYDNTYDQGTRSWLYRRQSVLDLIKSSDPDILCLQEAMENQYDYIREKLSAEYFGVGLARDYDTVNDRHIGEYAPILFKTRKFELIDRDTFWLSETPCIKGSKSWDSCCTRICTWCKLKYKESEDQYVMMFNTHWDHIGVEARMHSSDVIKSQMLEQLRKLHDENPNALPVIILTGDLNCVPTTEELVRLYIPLTDEQSNLAIRLRNAKKDAKIVEGPIETFTDFDFSLVIEIDYVLWQQNWDGKTRQKWTVELFEVIPDVVNEEYDSDEGEEGQLTYVASDHRPVITKFAMLQ